MSNNFEALTSSHSGTSRSEQRAAAVAAALELIRTYAGSNNPKFSLSGQMKMVSEYADLIQAALKVK